MERFYTGVLGLEVARRQDRLGLIQLRAGAQLSHSRTVRASRCDRCRPSSIPPMPANSPATVSDGGALPAVERAAAGGTQIACPSSIPPM